MSRSNTVAGPAGLLSFLTLAWLAAGGVALVWVAAPGQASVAWAALARLLIGHG